MVGTSTPNHFSGKNSIEKTRHHRLQTFLIKKNLFFDWHFLIHVGRKILCKTSKSVMNVKTYFNFVSQSQSKPIGVQYDTTTCLQQVFLKGNQNF